MSTESAKLSVDMPQAQRPNQEEEHRAAARRVGSTPEERARWLLDFCQNDLPGAGSPQRWALRQDWAYLLGLPVIPRKRNGAMDPSGHPTTGETQQWWQDLRGKLGMLVAGQAWEVRAEQKRELRVRNGALTSTPSTKPLHDADRHLVGAFEILEAVTKWFKLCANAKCGRPFIRTGREKYCSKRCKWVVGKRAYRRGVAERAGRN